MANYSTNLYTAQKDDRARVSTLAGANQASGSVELAVIPFTGQALAANDVITLAVLPPGIIPVPQLSDVTTADGTLSTLVLNIGTATVPDGWAKQVTVTAGKVAATANSANLPTWVAPTSLVGTGDGRTVVQAKVVSGSATNLVKYYFTLAYKRGR